MSKYRFSFLFSLGTTIFTFLALLIGNLVVATDSGDACGESWPKCNGYWFPDFSNYHTVIEYSHRLFTTLLGFVILINALLVFKTYLKKKTASIKLALLSLFLLLFQSVVGGLNVRLGTPVGFTTFDVTFSLSLLVCLIFLTTSLHNSVHKENPNRMDLPIDSQIKASSILLFVSLYANIILGAFFKHSRASKLVLNIQPEETLFTKLFIPELLYSIHGIFSITIVIGSVFLFLSLRNSKLNVTSVSLLICITLATLVGFASYLTQLKPFVSSMHMALSTISLGLLSMIMAHLTFSQHHKGKN